MSEHECAVEGCERPARLTLAYIHHCFYFCAKHYDDFMKLLDRMKEIDR